MSSLSHTPTPKDLSITPRDRRFGRDDKQGRWWLNGDPIASVFHTALSVTFPKGEAMFIEAVKAHRDGVDEKLAREIRAFTQQEVIHSREHVVFNKKAMEAGYDLSELEGDIDRVMEIIKSRPPIVNLMATIALEHYTAMMASVMLRDDKMYEGGESEWAALWKWHAIEEIEHKGVAYDTWLHATKDWSRWKRWWTKSAMMMLVTMRFWPRRVKGMKALLRQDGLTGWRITARIWWYLLGTPGVLRKSFLPWLSYFMPGFHPWNHDDRALIKKYESDYADAIMPAYASKPELAATAA
ncbi:metal-dependent hydrolase [Sphingopyxis sp. R3-92]|uniref:metal-dependent hydrolase n=1 Tax=Sphingopyxis sp. R3-92 TaxID=3158553 RepID=UPI003EE5B9DD